MSGSALRKGGSEALDDAEGARLLKEEASEASVLHLEAHEQRTR